VLRAFTIQFKYYWNYAKARNTKEENFYFRHQSFADPAKIFVYLLLLASLLSLPMFSVLGTEASLPGETNPECYDPFFFIFLCQLGIELIGYLYLLVKFIKFRDPFSIRLEFIIVLTLVFVTLGPFTILNLVDHSQHILPEKLQPTYFYIAYCYLYPIFSLWFPLFVAYRRHQIIQRSKAHEETFSDTTLKMVFESPVLLEAFTQVVAEHWSSECLLFVLDSHRYATAKQEDRPIIARRIFENHILPGSRYEVNIDASEVDAIREKMFTGEAPDDLFNNVEQYVPFYDM